MSYGHQEIGLIHYRSLVDDRILPELEFPRPVMRVQGFTAGIFGADPQRSLSIVKAKVGTCKDIRFNINSDQCLSPPKCLTEATIFWMIYCDNIPLALSASNRAKHIMIR